MCTSLNSGEVMGDWSLIESELLQWLKNYTGPKFSAILCDSPYHLTSITERFGKEGSAPAKGGVYNRAAKGFMGKSWDGGDISFQSSTWAAIKEVMYPGAFGMAFAGSRGWHRMACAIEDAGFIFHPSIFMMCYCYGSGFPKATRIDTQIDKAGKLIGAGNRKGENWGMKNRCPNCGKPFFSGNPCQCPRPAPTNIEAAVWNGHRYGLQALKPAAEPIIVFQKPYEGKPLENITKTGAGALNIDGGRIDGAIYNSPHTSPGFTADKGWNDNSMKALGNEKRVGRWPANLCLSHTKFCKRVGTKRVDSTPAHPVKSNVESYTGYGSITQKHGEEINYGDKDGKETVDDWECVEGCPVKELNQQSGLLKSGTGAVKKATASGHQGTVYGAESRPEGTPNIEYGDEGGASRFFFNADWNLETEEKLFESSPFRYCPKASRSEREAGLDGISVKDCGVMQDDNYQWKHDGKGNEINLNTKMRNHHPTVKPISLARWLAVLLLPPPKYAPRRLLVPFAGVGSEMVGALLAGWDEIVGVEMMPEYVKIGRARLEHWSKQPIARKVAPKTLKPSPKGTNTLDAYLDRGA